MEKLIKGSQVKDSEGASGKEPPFGFSILVEKGHEECGDSAFVFSDQKKLIAGVFDGVSGEPGAAMASSDAARSAFDYLKGLDEAGEKELQEALIRAHLSIRTGSTTASLLFLDKGGTFTLASIGDSPIFSIDSKGEASLELPLARVVKDNDSIFKFFHFRNAITSALGGPADALDVHIRSGKLKKGEMLILASDALNDNLYIETQDGYVTESTGKKDLGKLVGGKKSAKAICDALCKAIKTRIAKGKVERKGMVLVPKEDDIALIVVLRS
ncbi:MAG: hypothetical protein V1827_01510 [Candidatus Micrarchaeota archaeon]